MEIQSQRKPGELIYYLGYDKKIYSGFIVAISNYTNKEIIWEINQVGVNMEYDKYVVKTDVVFIKDSECFYKKEDLM